MKQLLLPIVIICTSLWSGLVFSFSGLGDPARGQITYSQQCVMCHGSDGRGQNGMAPNFFEEWPRLTKSDSELANSIRDEYRSLERFYTAGNCPQHVLSDEKMEDLLAYLRGLTEKKEADFFEMDLPDDFRAPF